MADQEIWTDDPIPTVNAAPAAPQGSQETWTDDPVVDPKTGQVVTPVSEVTVTGHKLNTPSKGEDLSAGAVAQGALHNALPSAWNAIKGIGEGLWNATPGAYLTGTPLLGKDAQGHTTVNLPPTQSALINLGTGLAQQGTNAALGSNAPQFADPSTARTLEKTYADRYGGWDNIKNSVKNDPASVLLDAVSVLDPAIKGVGLAGDAAKASTVAQGASGAAKAAQASTAADVASHALQAGVQAAPHAFDQAGKLILDSDIKNGPGNIVDKINAQGQRNQASLKPTDPSQISPQDLNPQVVKQHIAQGGELNDVAGMTQRQAAANAAENTAKGFQTYPVKPAPQPAAAPAAPQGGALSQQFQAGRAGTPFDKAVVADDVNPLIKNLTKPVVKHYVGALAGAGAHMLGGSPLVDLLAGGAADVGSGVVLDNLHTPLGQAGMAYGAGRGLRYGQQGLSALGNGAKAGALGALDTGAAGNVASNTDYAARNAKTYDTDMSLREYKALNRDRYTPDR